MACETMQQKRARVHADALARAMEANDPDRQATFREARQTLNARLRSAAGLSPEGERPTIAFERPDEPAPESGQGLDQGTRSSPGKPAPTRQELNAEMNRRMRASLGRGGGE